MDCVCDVCDKETASCLTLCPDCLEKERKQGALDFGEQILKRISFLKLSPAENNLVFIEQGIKDYIKVLKEGKL